MIESPSTALDPLSDAFIKAPYPLLSKLREESPVVFCPAIDMWLVTRFADVEFVFNNPQLFSASIAQMPLMPLCDEAREILATRFHLQPVMSNLDPPAHGRIRKRLAQAFSARRMKMMEPIIEARCEALIDAFPSGPSVDLVEWLCYPLPAQTIFTLIGFPEEDTDQIKQWCADKLIVNWGRPSAAAQIRAAETMAAFWEYCVDFVQNTTHTSIDNLTSALLEDTGRDEPLSHREVASIVFGLSFAGHETTSNLAANAIHCALQNKLWANLGKDAELTSGVVEETLRYASSVVAWRRIAKRDTQIGNVEIPKDAKLYLSLAAANHDPRHFKQAEVFDPARKNAADHTSFGKGIHFCLGATLARIEVAIVIKQLVARFPNMCLAEIEAIDYSPNIAFRGPLKLEVELNRDDA